MSRWHSYLQKAEGVIGQYDGGAPLAPVLKEYFKLYKQMGSTDRRYVSDLVYSYYRLGRSALTLPVADRILWGHLLCRQESTPLMEALRPEWAPLVGLPLADKMAALSVGFSVKDIFPWGDQLSHQMDWEALATSHLYQPPIYIRVRPGYEAAVRKAFGALPVQELSPSAWSLANSTDLAKLMLPGKEYVIQDLNSQRVGELMQLAIGELGDTIPRVWDCCAASGGKSILLKDLCPEAVLTVSDVRASILANLDKRFEEAGIGYEHAFTADLSRPYKMKPGLFPKDWKGFDLVMADVPCSGSGTWSRTPEQLYFFKKPMIAEYAALQQAILSQVSTYVRPGGYLLLVTCSVFSSENEGHIPLLTGKGFELVQEQSLIGYDQQADTLYGALLKRKEQ
jgi:16S rRNA (cytosine967-C5)-methyltransferase